MRQKKFLCILALLCTMVQGTWAQDSWDDVYAMTNTTAEDWTQLTEESTTGKTFGEAGTTTYYYAGTNLTFSNSTAGGSGLTILGTVYFYVPQGVTVTCTGANADGQTGAGAGIELAAGNALCLIGQGAVSATGGNAANGGNGTNGTDADWDSNNYWSGTGGNGGYGGGGAGAGIGTCGGNGGQGGSGADRVITAWKAADGGSGAAGQAGATAGAMGALYTTYSFGSLTATGGAAASQGGSAGGAGKSAFYDGTGYNYTAAGGGGGGAGGFGGAASNIGTGGPGGGGGGGGASGILDWSTEPGYYVVKAPGGKGGQNADGTWAAAGAESIMNHNAIKSGQVKINASGWEDDAYNYDSYVSKLAVGTEGSGGARGSASTSESAITVNIKLPEQSEWDMVCQQTKTSQSQWRALPPGSYKGATIGTAGATTYYFATGDRTFTNVNAGSSGLTILGTVYLFIPTANQITCTGVDANGTTGGGAGIELTAGNKLYLIGHGKLVATGGNAANGINGTNGGNASYDTTSGNHVRTGSGGRGGDGGGGAGAGIGTRGGNGGNGGTGVKGLDYEVSGNFSWHDNTGYTGNNGTNGGTAADMGTLYIYYMSAPTTEIHGGREFYGERYGGSGGLHALKYYETFLSGDWVITMAGGAGGGAGGGGGAASDIGTGGAGGGGGGGGASGSIASRNSATAFYQVGAKGGQGGVYANGTRAGDGETTLMWSCEDRYMAQMPRWEEVQYTNDGWYDNVDHSAAGGSGGSAGAAARSGSAIIVGREWPAQGEGTEEAPYLISNTETWDIFTEFVNTGTNFSGQYVKLTEDISVVTMAGGSETRGFHGTFDGAGHMLTFNATGQTEKFVAPFRCVGGTATIKNLKTAGTISTNNMYAAGLVASIEKSNENSPSITVENCRSSMAINNSGSGELTLSGLVGRLENASLTISGCVFDGSLAGRNATGNAGFVSWIAPNSNVNIKDCLFAPSSLSTSTDLCATIARKDDDASAVLTITNCYFTKALGTEQGTKAVAATSIPVGLGSPSTEYGMVTVYANGIYCDGTYYGTFTTISLADNADNSTTISDANGYVADVTLTGRTLYRDGAWNTLCLPFSVDNFIGTPLGGATVKTLASTGFTGGTLTMNFTEDVSSIEAGKPYIVKWAPFDLSTLTTHYTAQDGDVLTGTLGANVKISIAAGATVMLQDVTINGKNLTICRWAGITCLGDATIILKGTNTVKGFEANYPGIYVPEGSTLTIRGSGSLDASSNRYAAGIGSGDYFFELHCGNIVIEGGTINATGGAHSAGIGSARETRCGNITIEGGTITAKGGCAGIGSGSRGSCGNITITNGVTSVTAIKGEESDNSIGAGFQGSCGTVTIGGVEGAIVDDYTYTGTGSGSVDVAMPNLVNPEFKSVIISDAPANVSTDYVDFVSTYSPVSIYTDEKTNLYLGADNTLYYPTATGFKVNAFRGYFQLKGLTAGEPSNSNQASVRAFVLNFGDDSNATGIVSAEANSSLFTLHSSLSEWYTLDGRRLDGQPTQRGIYIHGGKKVVVK